MAAIVQFFKYHANRHWQCDCGEQVYPGDVYYVRVGKGADLPMCGQCRKEEG